MKHFTNILNLVISSSIWIFSPSIGICQQYTGFVPFNQTDSPSFSNTRTFANADSLTYKSGFAKGYTIEVQLHKKMDEPWLDPAYRVDMNNDGDWETGWRSNESTVTFDYPPVDADEYGTSTIHLYTRHYVDNDPVYNDYYFDVLTMHTPDYAFDTAAADLMVGFVSSDGILDKPLVIVEGFDSFNSIWPSYYYYSLRHMISDYLSPAGYDIFIINYADGSTFLQDNAMVVLGALEKIVSLNCPITCQRALETGPLVGTSKWATL
ncbi:MAG: hypothetical protein K9N34_03240 [Candidatus Marinimicrobia bacterium]|nr:hypothetical protein [Candidatus Neomarinimicrobiota bacterium]MCF7839448.1 hypothetical protein [Candidatus Neomarinimicrobiota bacterium]